MKQIQKIAPFAAMAVGAVLALATSAFKQVPKDKNDDPMFTFQYHAPNGNDFSSNAVQNVSNWQFTSSPTLCAGSDKACTLEVPQGFVDNPSTPGVTPTLDASILISTAVNDDGFASVSGTAAGQDAVIANQTE